MKNCILGLCILGLTNLITAQNDLAMVISNINDISSKTSVIKYETSKVNNEHYLNSSTNKDLHLAARIKTLQKIAADYDITKERIYSSNKAITYDVVFDCNENFIKAVYDYNGTILSSEEYYEDIRIPYVLSTQLAKEYPGWSFDNSNCTILYSHKGKTTYTYKLKLKKGKSTKSITRKI